MTKDTARLSGVDWAQMVTADGSLRLRLAPTAMAHAADLEAALQRLLGPLPLDVEAMMTEDKVLQYTSVLDGASARPIPSSWQPAR